MAPGPRTHALCNDARHMARPKQHELRDRQFNLKLTARELEMVQQRAAARGMRVAHYGRAQLLAEWRMTEATALARTPHLDPLFLASLSRVGNNLNQIARKMNTFNQPAPASLEALLQEIRTLISRGGGGDR
jgi:hypothetical protein